MREDWSSCLIEDVANRVHYGYTASSEISDGGAKYLRITDIQDGHVDWSTVPSCSITDKELVKFRLSPNDLVFARTGGTVGKSYLISQDVPNQAVFASYLIRIILNSNIEPRFIYLFFQSLNYWEQIELGKTGLKTNVNAQILSKVRLNLAPLPEQRAIVSKIEQLFSAMDNGTANLKKAQAQLKVYRQAVLKKAFNGELNQVEMVISSIEDHTTLVTKGASPKWQGFDYCNDETQLLFITSENVREGFISLEKEKYLPAEFNLIQERSTLQIGDVLFNIVGASIGRAAIFNIDKFANINQAVALIRPDSTVLNSYLNYYLNSESARQAYLAKQVDVARANLSLKDVREIPLPYCSIEEQHQIVQEIESRLSVCDKLEESIRESLQKSEALRQSILKRAFAGQLLTEEELVACRQEKDWESSGVLLERVRNGKSSK